MRFITRQGRVMLLAAMVVVGAVGAAAAQEDAERGVCISPKILYSPGLGGIYGILDETLHEMGSGVFHGFGYSVGGGEIADKDSSTNATLWFGTSFSYGYEVRLPENLQLLFGASIGIYNGWHMLLEELPQSRDDGVGAKKLYIEMREGFGGPFVRVRWHSVELMYQMLFGAYMKLESYSAGDNARKSDDTDMKIGFGVLHQLTLGYCFWKNPK
jgi:hypothetical protein